MESYIDNKKLRLAIGSLASLADTLIGKNKQYEGLLKEVLLDYNGESPWRNLKTYELKLGLKPGRSKVLLMKIWEDLCALLGDENEAHYIVTETIYFVSASYFKQYFWFSCKLPQCPRLGDMITFPFLDAAVGSTFFHVSHIEHEFDNNKQCIHLSLQSGVYNSYKIFDKDKEEFEEDQRRERYWEELRRKREAENPPKRKRGRPSIMDKYNNEF